MRKLFVTLALMMGITAMAANTIVDTGKPKDNWYIGVGIGSSVWNNANSWTLFNDKFAGNHYNWRETQPFLANFLVGKMINPYVGAEIDYTAAFNLYGSHTFMDAHNLTGNVVFNITNLLGGYRGHRRGFEVELIGGAGWLHYFASEYAPNDDALSFRAAVRGNINVNEKWAIIITPEYMWIPKKVANTLTSFQGVNLSVGFKYRIPTKHGGFPMARLYDQEEVDALNGTINSLLAANSELESRNAELVARLKQLLEEAKNVTVETKVVGLKTVHFEQGSYEVTEEKVAALVDALKMTEGTITLTGTTSPEGSEAFNKKLALNRANAVKEALVASGIDESRISVVNDYEDQRSVIIAIE